MLPIRIQSRHEFTLAIERIREDNLVFYAADISANQQQEQLTDDEVAEFLGLIRLRPHISCFLLSLKITGHKLQRTLDLSFLPRLEELCLNKNWFTRMPKVHHPSRLKTINMDDNRLQLTPYLSRYPRLKNFFCRNNNLRHDFIDLHKCTSLRKLGATANNFITIPLGNFKKKNVDYYIDRVGYTDTVKTLAFAANKHLEMKIYGYIRLRPLATQLGLNRLGLHFRAVAHDFSQICTKRINSDLSSSLMPASVFTDDNFLLLTTLLIAPQMRNVSVSQLAQIVSYVVPSIDPVRREINKFDYVFTAQRPCAYPVFAASKQTWTLFKDSELLCGLEREARNKMTAYYENILNQIRTKPCVRQRLMLNQFVHANAQATNIDATAPTSNKRLCQSRPC